MQLFCDGKLAAAFALLVRSAADVGDLGILVTRFARNVLPHFFAKIDTARGNGAVDSRIDDHVVTDGFGRERAFGDLRLSTGIVLAIAAYNALNGDREIL